METYKNPLQQAKAMTYPKPELNDDFYSNAYKDGYKIKGNEARLGKGRLNYLVSEYGVWDDNSDYAKAYLGYVDPREFIKGTTVKGSPMVEELANQPELDLDRINSESQTPFLSVDFDNWRVKGHEGRHRLSSFAKSGIKRVPVVIRDYSPSYRKDKSSRKTFKGGLVGQKFGETPDEWGQGMQLESDLIPLNYKNIAKLYEMFGE